jgi:cyclic beta-1,2-glucan synthetase
VQALRGELYASEHLIEHALEVARAHGAPSTRITAGPLRKRFAAARTRLRSAYELLTRDYRNRHEPTPAEEWLLDNSHVVEEQIREIQEDLPWGYLVKLPRISRGAMRGYPRVYGLCLDYLRHTDARVDLASLANYVRAYQRVSPLTIGELWAVPIMLRLGLTLVVGALAVSEANTKDRALADEWAERLLGEGSKPSAVTAVLAELERSKETLGDAFYVQLVKRLREHDAPLGSAFEWVRARCAAQGTTPEELTRRQHLRQAADQVSVGNAITSMRAITALEWAHFFELTSHVEQVLQRDPAGAYPLMDRRSRDHCRHAIERLSRRSRFGEQQVAELALSLADRAHGDPGASPGAKHVGYYLVGDGLDKLERALGYRRTLHEWIVRPILARPSFAYLSAFAVLWGAALYGIAAYVGGMVSNGAAVALTLLAALPASELALALLHSLVVFVFPPRLLPKLDFERGIPDEHRTLVVVPTLLESPDGIRQLLEDLEVRSLANPDSNFHFALLTDFVDAAEPQTTRDAELLEHARAGIEELNRRFGKSERYWLLHRRRLYNATEQRYMGWERKRGKLEELNALLRGDRATSFELVTAPAELLQCVRFVITLDADTELPREVARRLVGIMAHPQNRPVLDPERQRVVAGHAIVQPRVGTLPLSTRRSRFARVFAGPPGIDPYTTAVSDVYQDLFGEGSFVGKGIYDVDAFSAALAQRVPENQLLSHDLFEGCYARSALATDVELLDEQPASYEVVASRQHRWLRGDWQLLPWLLPRVPRRGGTSQANDLRVLDLIKIVDNLRRSLVAPAIVALCLTCWFLVPGLSPALLLGLALYLIGPLVVRQALSLSRRALQAKLGLSELGGELLKNLQQIALTAVVTLDQAVLAIDGIARTLYRLLVSRKRLLEWTTMSQAARQLGAKTGVSARLLYSGWASAAVALALLAIHPRAAPYALPLLLAWTVAPGLLSWLGRAVTAPAPVTHLSAVDRRMLRLVARKTWRFFETFVTAADHHLPPDNYQQDPRGVVAHRTSPTNIGLYLLSIFTARDFGFITTRHALERAERTLDTLSRMEKRHGHILNWYDTTDLRPLEPQYVSTVDSGNLAAYLWTLRQACWELFETPLASGAELEAARDALRLAAYAEERRDLRDAYPLALPGPLSRLDERLAEAAPRLERGLLDAHAALSELSVASAEAARSKWAERAQGETRFWLERAAFTLEEAISEHRQLAPFLEWIEAAPPSLHRAELAPHWRALTALLEDARSPAQLLGAVRAAMSELDRFEPALASAALPAYERAACGNYLSELRKRLIRTSEQLEQLRQRALAAGENAGDLADSMDFGFLYDEGRGLFAIGYNVSGARLDGSYYDLLASEARLASLVAISKGDAPLQHWSRLSRPRALTSAGPVLLSWSGSMFEYLMPLLVTGVEPETLLWETCHAAIGRQIEYARQRQIPWGISESAYNVMDLGMTYQYRAFGVPGLGLKSGLGGDLVIAPYATVLAALLVPDAAVHNLRALSRAGLEGDYGYYEAADYTKGHIPPERRSVVVKAFMAHHQGMSLVALGNVLGGAPMQRRFYADARVKASALLLEERVPRSVALVQVRAAEMAPRTVTEPELNVTDHAGLVGPTLPRAHLLGHGQLSTLLTAAGSGVVTWQGLDVTRFREDAALEAGGIYVYVRDLTRHRVWSAAQLPCRTVPDYYDVNFAIDGVQFRRRDGSIETATEITVSPEHLAELRRFTLTNHGEAPVEIDLTTYCEPVLATRAADLAHRAFSSMFIETELLPARGAVLARRRPRSQHEQESWLLQVLVPDAGEFQPAELTTSRAEFVGRGGTLEAPAGMAFGHTLGGAQGTVLDPALVLRMRVRLAPARHARVALVTALATSRQAALELLDLVTTPHFNERSFELAWADARVELKHLGISAAQSHRFQRLLSCLLFAPAALRDTSEAGMRLTRGRSGLWAHGISGDLPILLLRIDVPDFAELCRELLLAHEFWRLNGMQCDLVILNDEPSGYLQPMHEAALDLVRSSPAQGHENQRGGVFVRRTAQLSPEERALLLRASRVVLRASAGSLAQQLRAAAQPQNWPEQLVPPRRPALRTVTAAKLPEDLQLFNGWGGFARGGREYVMRVASRNKTPMPWCNVMANPHFGSVVSESGSAFTWHGSSQRERLTPWSNDATADPSGELLYLRDQDDGSSWSATPAPAGEAAEFVVRHGQGYSVFEHTRAELEHELTQFVAARDPIKIFRLRLSNRGTRARRLALYFCVEWVLGGTRDASRVAIATHFSASQNTLFAENPFAPAPEQSAFMLCSEPASSFTADRQEFFGFAGSRARPAALSRRKLSGRCGVGLDPCGALQTLVSLAPGQTHELFFVLGQAKAREAADALIATYSSLARVDQELLEVKRVWDRTLSISVATPDAAFDVMVNRWLLYQVTSARLWARSGFYQSSGAYGFRDQLQDVLALLHVRPELARLHILRAAARQFVEGDVQHWWHPESGEGVRSRCSDDLAWLPFAVAEYVSATADAAILDEPLPFLQERMLAEGEEDVFGAPPASSEQAPLYEHCVRALRTAVTQGPRGLPKIGSGDWNDGMNRVGLHGSGESVWLGWFLARTLRNFAAIARGRGDRELEMWCDREVERLRHALEQHAWDGAWYRRAFHDDGSVIGSRDSEECRIDAIAQSWAVLSGIADPARARQAMASAEQHLIQERERMMLLLTPPFSSTAHDPGYIRSYPAGIRENGGQYTHGVLWTVQAFCELGEADRAYRLFSMLNPVSHGSEREQVLTYKVEPYVVAADVYSAPEHIGRGGWTWYTGSAAWMYRIAVEQILGLKIAGKSLFIQPHIPSHWRELRIEYAYGSNGSSLDIRIENPTGVGTSVRRVELDGKLLTRPELPLLDDGARHEVRIVTGERKLGVATSGGQHDQFESL